MTDLTWDWAAFRRIFSRPSTYVFFTSYVSLTIVAVAQATFLPTILSQVLYETYVLCSTNANICLVLGVFSAEIESIYGYCESHSNSHILDLASSLRLD